MSTQPEALRLADELVGVAHDAHALAAAAELRRLHAENERLAALIRDYAKFERRMSTIIAKAEGDGT